MDLFDLYLPSLQIFNSFSIINPVNQKGFYADFSSINLNLFYKEDVILKNTNQTMIFENNIGVKYKLKRNVILYEEATENLLLQPKIFNFIKSNFLEFQYLKLLWAHPNSVAPIDLKISRLVKNKLIVTELLTQFPGQSLYLLDAPTKKSLALNIIRQTASIFSYLDYFKIPSSNFSINDFYIDNSHSIKLADLNTIYSTMENQLFLSSPERFQNTENFSIKKSNVYSWGLLILTMFDIAQDRQLDQFKYSEEKNKNVLLLTDQILKIFPNNNIGPKISQLLKKCLCYKSEERINFNQIFDALTNIEKININKYTSSEIKTKAEMRLENSTLRHNYSIVQDKCNKIQEELNNSKRSMTLNQSENSYFHSENLFNNNKKLNELINELKQEVNKISSELDNEKIRFKLRESVIQDVIMQCSKYLINYGINLSDLVNIPEAVNSLILYFQSPNFQPLIPKQVKQNFKEEQPLNIYNLYSNDSFLIKFSINLKGIEGLSQFNFRYLEIQKTLWDKNRLIYYNNLNPIEMEEINIFYQGVNKCLNLKKIMISLLIRIIRS